MHLKTQLKIPFQIILSKKRLFLVLNCLITFCMSISRVNGQGNRGIIINNQKIDSLSSNEYPQLNRLSTISSETPATSTTTTVRPQTPSNTATTKKLTTASELLVTINSFRPQKTTSKPNEVTLTVVNPHNPQQNIIKPNLPIFNDLQNIQHILKQNRSDVEKIDEIVKKLNKTGTLTKINVLKAPTGNIKARRKTTPLPISTTTAIKKLKNTTYVQSYEQHDHQKDSKELKVQFVLDCDLKDSANSNGLNVHRPTTPQYTAPVVKKHPVYYPNYHNTFNQRFPIKNTYSGVPNRQTAFPYYPQATRKTTKVTVAKPTTPKPKVKNIYVDPPAISAISNAFENVYNYLEDALTEKEKVPRRRKKTNLKKYRKNGNFARNRQKPISKRSTVRNKVAKPTSAPTYRSTQATTNKVNNKLATQIHVTSEYVGKDPSVPTTKNPDLDDDDDDEYDESDYGSIDVTESEYDEEDSDDYDKNDDEYDDDGDYYDLSFGGFGGDGGDYSENDEDSDDDENEENEDEGYSEPVPNKLNKSQKKKNKKHKYSGESGDYSESDEEEDGFTMTNMGNYFRSTYNTISNYMPAMPPLPSVFGGSDDDDEEEKDSPLIRRPKLKKSSLFNRLTPYTSSNQIMAEEKPTRWYDKFFFGSADSNEQTSTTPTTPVSSVSPTDAGFFNWLAGDSAESSEKTTTTEQSPPKQSGEQGWFSGLFGESTTKAPASTPETIDKKQQWLAMIANQIQAMKPTPSPNLNQTYVPKRAKYDNYQIWRVMPSTQAHLDYLIEYKESDDEEKVHWLKGPAMRGANDILVPPEMNKEVQDMLEYEAIPYEVVIWDLEKAIKFENPVMSRRQRIELEKEQGHPMTWYRYHDYEDIAIYLDYLQVKYPDLVELIHIGRSFEGRPLVVAKVSFDSLDGELPRKNPKNKKSSLRSRRKKKSTKPGVFIEAGVHGREWITPAVATWILKELVKFNSTEDGNSEKEVVRSVDWYIMPMNNPDGYEFSLNYDRMWRKTRSKLPDNRNSMLKFALKWLQSGEKDDTPICHGTDPNRNYNINWLQSGASTSPCSDYYDGTKPFSEPETKALSTFLDENKNEISLFISLHSYGQLITYPSTINTTYCETQRSNDLRDMAEVAVNALRDFASSARYSIDNTNEMLSIGSGTSTDYAMHQAGIKYSYTIELRDTGTQGFLLSPSYIDTTGLETYEMIKAMVDYI